MKTKNKVDARAKRRVRAARLLQAVHSPVQVAAMVGAPRKTVYRGLGRNPLAFDGVLTFEQTLLEALPNARFTSLEGCWLAEQDRKVHPNS